MLQAKMKRNARVIGASLVSASADNAEVLALAGLDFVVIPHADGAERIAEILTRLEAIKGAACAGLVRMPVDDLTLLPRLRALGAGGVIVDGIASAAAARDVVTACRAGHGAEPLFVVLVVERGAPVGEIAATGGIDLLLAAPHDETAEQALSATGAPLAGIAANSAGACDLLQRGYTFIIAGSDMMLLDAGAAAMLAAARSGMPPAPVAEAAVPAQWQRDANTSIRRMRQFWVAWCVAVLLLGAAMVGFGTLFALSESWSLWARIGGRLAAGLLALLAIYDAYRIATRGTAALQEVLAQNLGSIVVAELERLHAAATQCKLALAARNEPGALGLSFESWSFDGDDVRNLLGNPTEAALRDVLASIAAYNRLIDSMAAGDAAAESGLAGQIEAISTEINRAMASVAGRLDVYRQAAAR